MAVLSGRKSLATSALVLATLAGIDAFWGSSASASPYPGRKDGEAIESLETKEVTDAKKRLCNSTDEYIKTVKYLRDSKEFGFREEAARLIADEVSKGCDGAAQRFSQILVLLKSIGLSERKSLEMALEFAAAPPDVQKNFLDIFTKAFLTEFFDYEFPKAMRLAFELSKDYKGNATQARKDFISLVQFCKGAKNLDLPMMFCADYAIRVAKMSHYYQDGVAAPFLKLFAELRDKKELSLDVKTALEVAYKVTGHGPLAHKNFMQAFEFASTDFNFDKKKALDFAVKLAGRSHIDPEPPILQTPKGVAPETFDLPSKPQAGGKAEGAAAGEKK